MSVPDSAEFAIAIEKIALAWSHRATFDSISQSSVSFHDKLYTPRSSHVRSGPSVELLLVLNDSVIVVLARPRRISVLNSVSAQRYFRHIASSTFSACRSTCVACASSLSASLVLPC